MGEKGKILENPGKNGRVDRYDTDFIDDPEVDFK